MTKWTAKELDMARKGWVYHRYQKRHGMRAFVSRLTGYDRSDLVFDYEGYDTLEAEKEG